MSQADVSALLGAAIILPFGFAVAFVVAGVTPRLRGVLSIVYGLSAAGVNLALLNGFLTANRVPSWASFRLTGFNFPVMLVLELVSVPCMLYAGFRQRDERSQGLLTASIAAATGLAAAAVISRGLVAQLLLWEGVTACAIIGLAVGKGDIRRKLVAFIPWLLGDVLFVVGTVLCGAWLKESSVLINPPLISGSETQVVIIAALFLASALIRLGAFPFHFWIRDLLGRTDSSWSAFFLPANFLLAGSRLVITSVFLGRLVASNWSTGIVIAGLASIVAGPLIALLGASTPEYVAGLYAFQAGVLVVGVGFFSRSGLEGALFCLLATPLLLSACMMSAGTADSLRGTRRFFRQGISARVAPAAFAALLISGFSLAGLPPLDGFVSKALVALAGFDRAMTSPFYALASGLILAAVAAAAVAAARALGGVFLTAGVESGAFKKPSPVEGASALALCAGSFMLGLFPGVLLRNFIRGGSVFLFPSGFTGPGVAFLGTGAAAQRAVTYYISWSETAAAFLLVSTAIALALYFAARAGRPSGEAGASLEPFVGGCSGRYGDSAGSRTPLLPRVAGRRWQG